MRAQLYDLRHSDYPSGNYMLYSPEQSCCSAFTNMTQLHSCYNRLLCNEFSYFIPSNEPLLAEFNTLTELEQNYPELFI